MTKRTPQTISDDSLSSLERLYIYRFNKVHYCFDVREMSTQASKHGQSPRQISVDHIKSYVEYFALMEQHTRQGQMLSYEQKTLALPVGTYAIFEQYTPHEESGELYLHNSAGHIVQYAEVSSTDLSTYIAEYFGLKGLFSPRFKVTYRARLMKGLCPIEHRDVWCVVEDQVSYIEPNLGLKLAQEPHSRIYWLSNPPQLDTLTYIPLSSRYWMGEYYYKRLYRLPCNNELPGFEYEAKLSPLSLAIDESLLPYPVIERYQTESVRWYLPKGKGRVGFREGRASLVKKGKKILINGIMKRREEKTQGLSMWQMTQEFLDPPNSPSPPTLNEAASVSKQSQISSGSLPKGEKELSPADDLLQMRRVKRQLYILHPKSHRVYALCLDDCRAPNRLPFHQIELEYNGKLCLDFELLNSDDWLSFHTQLKAAKILADSVPKAASRCLERARLFMAQAQKQITKVQAQELDKLSHYVQEKLLQEQKVMEVDAVSNLIAPPELEAEIIAEMKLILSELIHKQSCQTSIQTKRAWLKGIQSSVPKDKSKKNKSKKQKNKDKPTTKKKSKDLNKDKHKKASKKPSK